MNPSDIEKMIASDNVTAPLLKEALEDLKKENQVQRKKELLAQMREVQARTLEMVNRVRSIRQKEKAAVASLRLVAEAEKAFLASGDYEAYLAQLAKNHF